MNKKIITTTEEFLKLKPDWERLEKQSPDVTYYSTFEYISTWWSVYEKQKKLQLFIIVIEHDNKIVGIGPFLLEKINKRFIKYTELKFIGRGDYLDVLIDFSLPKPQTVIKEMMKVIEDHNNIWDQVNLTHINQNTFLSTYLFKSKYNNYFKYLIETPYLDLKQYNDFNDYKKKFIPSNINQYKNKLKRDTNYNIEISYENVIDELSRIHIQEKDYLKNLGRSERYSLFEDKLRLGFMTKLYKLDTNTLTFFLKDSDGTIIGYDTGFVYKKIYNSWNIAFNPVYSKYRVGKIIKFEFFEYLFESNKDVVFDFGSGRYSWKFEWTDQFNLVYQLQYTNPENKKLEKYNKLMRIKRAIKS